MQTILLRFYIYLKWVYSQSAHKVLSVLSPMHSHKSNHLLFILPPTLFPHSPCPNCCFYLAHFYLDSHCSDFYAISVFLAAETLFKVFGQSEMAQIAGLILLLKYVTAGTKSNCLSFSKKM